MNNLRGTLTNGMNAKEFECLGVEQHFQHSGPVAEHFRLCEFLVSGDTCFIGNSLDLV